MGPLMDLVVMVAEEEEKRQVGAGGRADRHRYRLRRAKNDHYTNQLVADSSSQARGSESAAFSLPLTARSSQLDRLSKPKCVGSLKCSRMAIAGPIEWPFSTSSCTGGRQLHLVRPLLVTASGRLHSIGEQEEEDSSLEAMLNDVARLKSSNHNNTRSQTCHGLTTAALCFAALGLLSTLTCTHQHEQPQPPYDNRYRLGNTGNNMLPLSRAPQLRPPIQAENAAYATQRQTNAPGRGANSQAAQVWSSRALVSEYRDGRAIPDDGDPTAQLIVRRTTAINNNNENTKPAGAQNVMKSVRHAVSSPVAQARSGNTSTTNLYPGTLSDDSPSVSTLDAPLIDDTSQPDACSDRLCYGLPEGCLSGVTGGSLLTTPSASNSSDSTLGSSSLCRVMVTAKSFIDPSRPVSRDIIFELMGQPHPGYKGNYAAVGFSDTGRMAGLVTECIQYRDPVTGIQVIDIRHSFNSGYHNVDAQIISGIKKLGVTFENGYYQCRWIVESAVEFSFGDAKGGIEYQTRREDLGYKSYHILLAAGEFDTSLNSKHPHDYRVSSVAPLSLAQTGHIKSLGPHILIRIHGSLMIVIWIGFTTLSIILARYYKNEWSNLKISDSALWFVVHRTLMLASWFGTLIAIIFAFMYTETYHPGIHQISGTTCLVLTSLQVLGGLIRPSQESSKRVYFNWTHFVLGNLSYLCAMICLITAAFLAPAQLPPLYIWIIVIFVATYALTHITMTLHQYIVHKSSSKLFPVDELWLQTFIRPPLTPLENSLSTQKEISITPVTESSNSSSNGKHHNNKLTSNGLIAEHSFPKESSSPFRQFIMGILVTVIVIFIVLLISLVNIK